MREFLEAVQRASTSSCMVGRSTAIISLPSLPCTFVAPPKSLAEPLSPLVPHVTSCKLHMAYIIKMFTSITQRSKIGDWEETNRDLQEGSKNMYWAKDVNMWKGSKWRREPPKYRP